MHGNSLTKVAGGAGSSTALRLVQLQLQCKPGRRRRRGQHRQQAIGDWCNNCGSKSRRHLLPHQRPLPFVVASLVASACPRAGHGIQMMHPRMCADGKGCVAVALAATASLAVSSLVCVGLRGMRPRRARRALTVQACVARGSRPIPSAVGSAGARAAEGDKCAQAGQHKQCLPCFVGRQRRPRLA